MRALTFKGGELTFRPDYPDPSPEPGQALIKVRLAGICATDGEILKGYMGFSGVPGHEFVGEVIGGDAGEWLGRRVVGEINIACGECDMCRRGMPTHCRNRSVLGIHAWDGVFADMIVLPIENLHPVPDSIPDERAVFTEPLAAALQMIEMAPIRPTDRVILIGAGKLGLLIAQVLKLHGADLTVIARHKRQLDLLGAWGIRAARREDIPDGMADVVVEATGNPDGFSAALDIVRPRGTIMLKSTYHGLPQADLTRVVVNEIRLVGSRCGPFRPALRLLELGLIDVESMIDARYPLEEGVAALEHAAKRGTLKILLEVNGGRR